MRIRPLAAVILASMTLLSMVTGIPAVAGPASEFQPLPLQQQESVSTKVQPATNPAADDDDAKALTAPSTATQWPRVQAAEAVVPAASAPPAKVGDLPVLVSRAADTTPSKVRVAVVEHTKAEQAVVMRVSRADGVRSAGPVVVGVDYSGFRDAFGADWSTRLRLTRLPECALSTPDLPECAGETVVSSNDGRSRISAKLDAGPDGGLFMLDAGPAGPAGDYVATSLSPSAMWQDGGSSGSFQWSYPLRMPPAPGGAGPSVGFGYSSQSVDGRTAANNSQPSWIGEGFGFWPGSVERRYKACFDDRGGSANNTEKTGDLCWGTHNAVLTLNGKSTELLRDDASGAYRLRDEDGSKVERLFGVTNGAKDGEHWKITTPDGTQYFFGVKPETNSTWTAPVYGNNAASGSVPAEPCHGATFDTSWCQQAYRWNLDRVVDVRGNSTLYWYAKEMNNYGRNLSAAKVTSYVRGGHLKKIEYGTRTGAEVPGKAPVQVVFTEANRCIPNAVCDFAHPNSWPDAPVDQNCTGNPCSGKFSPTFWTTKRLAKVTTEVWNGTAHRPVDSWTLRHSFPDPQDGTRAGLWLDGITHTGLAGQAISMPEVTFGGVRMPNRVDAVDHSLPMNWWRLESIRTESGGEILVKYSEPDCVRGSRMPAAADRNTLRCFPTYRIPIGAETPVLDYFHKYVVTSVSETDHTGGGPRVLTTYEYPDPPAWHYDDDDGITPPKHNTWSQWRGYEKVRLRKGDPEDQTLTETRYFRGMDGDKLSTGTRTGVTVADSEGGKVTDSEPFAGMVREEITYLGSNVLSAKTSVPWMSVHTASRTINGHTVASRYVDVQTSQERVALDNGRDWRRTKITSKFDQFGMVTEVNDLGDVAVANDDRCTKTTYGRNTGIGLLTPVARSETYAVACGQPVATEADVIGDTRNSFDGKDYGVAPTSGNVTRVEVASSWAAGTTRYLTKSTAAFDAYGRNIRAWNAAGKLNETIYEPAIGLAGKVVASNPLGHKVTTILDVAWGLPLSTTDANDKKTEQAYDSLGRLTGVWLPGRVKGVNTANTTFAYLIRKNGAVAVSTSKLNWKGEYTTSHELYDSLMRERQTQTPSPVAGKRVLTNTFYDSAGRVAKTYGAYPQEGAASVDLQVPVDSTQVPTQYETDYDAAGRTAVTSYAPGGHVEWRATTAYGGDRVDQTPAPGGIATSTVTDARGNVVERRQFHGGTPTGVSDSTRYEYDRRGALATMVDAAGNRWTYDRDLRGRVVNTRDPDKGTTVLEYDDLDQLVTTTEARGYKLVKTYDDLGRTTAVHDGSISGPKRAEWVYDTKGRGLLSSSTRFIDGKAYTVSQRGYNLLDQSTGQDITLPELAETYSSRLTYHLNGSAASVTLPKAGSLPEETLRTDYNDIDQPNTLTTNYPGIESYVERSDYSEVGRLLQHKLTTGVGGVVYQAYHYEVGTERLNRSITQRSDAQPGTVADINYKFDPAGNVTRIADTPPAGEADVQCFAYDHVRRLEDAWTPASGDCATGPSAALGGPAKYWQSFKYDKANNRMSQVDHATSKGDVTAEYSYPPAGSPQPHAVQSVRTGASTDTYTYDERGNTRTRPGNQVLTWDAEGHLASVIEGGKTTSFGYDADGNRLLRRDPGTVTLYLGGTELRVNTTTKQITGTRHYTHDGKTIATRTATGLSWIAGDHQGTQNVSIAAGDQQVTIRRQTPFGSPRGTEPAWPSEKGFVGGDKDATGLVHLGAREYDPEIGRFVSVDPLLDQADPQQFDGYAYASNSPLTKSDANGLSPRYGSADSMERQNADRKRASQEAQQRSAAARRKGTRYGSADAGERIEANIREAEFRRNLRQRLRIPRLLITPAKPPTVRSFPAGFHGCPSVNKLDCGPNTRAPIIDDACAGPNPEAVPGCLKSTTGDVVDTWTEKQRTAYNRRPIPKPEKEEKGLNISICLSNGGGLLLEAVGTDYCVGADSQGVAAMRTKKQGAGLIAGFGTTLGLNVGVGDFSDGKGNYGAVGAGEILVGEISGSYDDESAGIGVAVGLGLGLTPADSSGGTTDTKVWRP